MKSEYSGSISARSNIHYININNINQQLTTKSKISNDINVDTNNNLRLILKR